jgi:hypothetical protein
MSLTSAAAGWQAGCLSVSAREASQVTYRSGTQRARCGTGSDSLMHPARRSASQDVALGYASKSVYDHVSPQEVARMPLPLWPGPGFTPSKPRPGSHAEVTFTGTKGRTGGGIPLLTKKNQAIVLITWPGGGSTSRTIKGNFTIRRVMEWCAAFNAECARLEAGPPKSRSTGTPAGKCPGCGEPIERTPGASVPFMHTASGDFACPKR